MHALSTDHDVSNRPPHADAEVDLELPAGTLQRLTELHHRHGNVFRLATRGRSAETYVVAHPEGAQQVLSMHHADYRPLMLDGHMSLVLGRGLLISDGGVWKNQRKLMQRCFGADALERILGHIRTSSAALLERWRTCESRGETIELTRAMRDLSIDFNFNALFGDDAPAMLRDIGVSFLEQLTAPMKADTRRNLLFLKENRRTRECIARLIAARRRSDAPAGDLLGMFMETRSRAGDAMPDQQIVDEVVSILTAGHETIASALKSVWCEISQHPSVAQALRQEADSLIGSAEPSISQINSLHYTEQVIREALRLHPPVWVITHKAERNTWIGRYHVPADTNVFVCPYLIHRHKDVWPEPDVFDPHRFAPSRTAARHAHAYLPFSIGPRNCIGDDLSMLEMMLHVAAVMHVFDVVHVDGSPGNNEAGFLLRTRTPIHVRLQLRARTHGI